MAGAAKHALPLVAALLAALCIACANAATLDAAGPTRPFTKRLSISGATCVSQCAVRPHTLELIAEDTELKNQHNPRFGSPQDLLHGLGSFATCVVDPSLSSSSSSGSARKAGFVFPTRSRSHKPFSRTIPTGPGAAEGTHKTFYVSSTPNCPVCVEQQQHATAATHDPASPFAHRCNGTCLDLCSPQWAAYDEQQRNHNANRNPSAVTRSSNASMSLRHRRDLADFFDDVVDVIGDTFDTVVDTVGGAFQDSIDDLREAFVDLSDDVVELIGEQFNALSQKLQDIVRGVASITEASLEDLGQLSQDILAHLRAVGDMTIAQLGHISQRLVDFAELNLENFLHLLDGSLFEQALQDFGCERRWAPSQARMFITRAVEVGGEAIGWDIDRFREIGTLVRGLAAGDVSTLKPLSVHAVILITSGVTRVPPDTVEALATRAVEVVGLVSSWNSTDFRMIGNVAAGLREGDLEAVADSRHLNALARVAFDVDLNRVATIADRGLELIGGPQSDDEEGWQRVVQFAHGLGEDKLRDLGQQGIRALGRLPTIGEDLGQVPLNMLLDTTVSVLGMPSTWDDGVWQDVGNLAANLGTDLLTNITINGIQRLGAVANIDINVAREALSQAVDQLGPMTEWSPEDFASIGNVLVGVSAETVLQLDRTRLLSLLNLENLPHGVLMAVLERFQELENVMLEEFTLQQLQELQPVLSVIPSETIRNLPAEAIIFIDRIHDLDHNQVEALLQAAVSHFGPVSSWDATTWQSFPEHAGDFAALAASELAQSSLISINADISLRFSSAALMTIGPRLTELLGAPGSLDQDQLRTLGDMIKALSPQDLSQLTEEAIPFLRDSLPQVLEEAACAVSRPCDAADAMALQDLPLCDEQSTMVGVRLRELYGEVSAWNATLLAHVGPLAATLSPADMGQLDTEQLSGVVELACLGAPLVECIVKRAIDTFQGGEGVAAWTADELRNLGNAVRGLDAAALRNISASVVVEALDVVVDLSWDSDQLVALADQAIAALGDTVDWTADTVEQVGNVLAGLADEDLVNVPANTFRRVTDKTLTALCDMSKLHVMTEAQLEALARVHASFDCESDEALFVAAQRSSVSDAQDNGGGGSGGISSGAVAAAVVVPIALIALIVLGVMVYKKRQAGGSYKSSSSSKGVSSVKTRVKDIELSANSSA